MDVALVLNKVMADDDGVKRVSVEEPTLQDIKEMLITQLNKASEMLNVVMQRNELDTERMKKIIGEKDAIILDKTAKIAELQDIVLQQRLVLFGQQKPASCEPPAPHAPSAPSASSAPYALSALSGAPCAADTAEQGCSRHDAEGKAKRPRITQHHTASYPEVTQAFLQCEPLFGVSGWRFKDTDCSKEFWTTIIKLPIYDDIDEGKRLKSVKKALNGAGYDHVQDDSAQKTSGETWETASVWQWDCVKALINCYWLNTTVVLDSKVKNMLKIMHNHYKNVARSATPVMNMPPMLRNKSAEDLKLLINNLFAFKTNKTKLMRVEKRKLQEFVQLNALLVDFEKQGKIIDVIVFRPWQVISADEEQELVSKLMRV